MRSNACGAQPGHAGAIHFYIHAMEASTKPEKALPYARELASRCRVRGTWRGCRPTSITASAFTRNR